ncbi:uncharacterized protein N7446_004448 [Penicillium canescens]|nr:uncharacterized protein N7446_004448 [Penicillium canescens]KAJ6067411.1 hypothetical protein N7446_004448 [Penicillium canescens]
MFLDLLVLCLPIPMAWRVKTTVRQKWVLTGVFLLGGFVCVVSILRIVSFDLSDVNDPTYTSIDPSTWSSVEQSLGIICACLPTLRPLIRRLLGSSVASLSSPASDSQIRLPAPVDEESGIMGTTLSSAPHAHIRATSNQLYMFQTVNQSSESRQGDICPISRFSQTNEMSSPVSAAESFA